MGTEILSIFIFAPMVLGVVDMIKIIRNKNRLKHLILLIIGFSTIGYMAYSSYAGGWNPMQGVVIGSFFYIPGYLVLYCGLTYYFNKTASSREEIT
ncbi:hypothetical protein [Thalassomonas sp. RHCl1]|uniref:hypothetical protein n=1 Tax=Thalassomonas sp. RHCl1 TaxID=2995320 RepID=UPI00248AC8C6|nr:hypothetical protein [Thalassomonas sp. RHCl1]